MPPLPPDHTGDAFPGLRARPHVAPLHIAPHDSVAGPTATPSPDQTDSAHASPGGQQRLAPPDVDVDHGTTDVTHPQPLHRRPLHGDGAPSAAVDGTTLAPEVTGWYVRAGKPLLDRVAAVVLLIALSPVLAAGMLAVRVTLGPGVFFVQQRVGQGGRVFSTFKLRTMAHDRRSTSDEDLQAFADGRWDGIDRRRTHKSAEDPRLNRVGQLLRTFSIDEIPQLVNIIRGDMSLVGPRPEIPAVVERHYEPWMHRRHAVKPGLTGLWQVSERGNGMMHEHVDVDLDYVDSISLWTDLRILLATPYAALGPRRGF